jgi:hypothetical protein
LRRLRASDAGEAHAFGFSASIGGSRVIVGAPDEDGPLNQTGLAGAAYLYNSTPRARPDSVATVGAPVTAAVLANDQPSLGVFDTATVRIESAPTGGTATVTADGRVTFIPDSSSARSTSFSYSVANKNGRRSAPTTVPVRALPDASGSGRALALDGTGAHVALPDDPALNTGGPYRIRTIELWFRADDVDPSTEQVLYEEGDASAGFNLYLRRGRLRAGAWSATANWPGTWLSTARVQDSTWHHVALVYDHPNGQLRAYLDGRAFGTAASGGRVATHDAGGAIGAARQDTKFAISGTFAGTGRAFGGGIDQVRVWNRALSRSAVRTLSRRTLDLGAPIADSLIAAYRFDVGTDTTAFDYATADSTSLDGVLRGSARWTPVSGVTLGDTSATLTAGRASLGRPGSAVTAENVTVPDGSALQLYRSGRPNGPLVDSSRAGEVFPESGPDRRLHVVWGVDSVGAGGTADLTFGFGGIAGVRDSTGVRLLRRDGPGARWTDVTARWTLDLNADAFTRTDASVAGQYAVGGTEQTLPVELVAFDGQAVGENVRLTWRTATERNNAGFRVDRRVGKGENGREGAWTRVGFVDGVGTTSEAQRYRFTDTGVPYEADALAYRLRQVDTNGTARLSATTTVARGHVERAQLRAPFPNPAARQVTLELAVPAAAAPDARLALYDVLGRRVRTVAVAPGRQTRRIDVSALSSGVYVLRLRAGSTVQTHKITVVR